MDATRLIWALVAVCGAVVAVVVFPGGAKRLGRFALRAAVCLGVAFGLNVLFEPLGWAIGLNPLTAVFCGFLGAPGLAALYICKAMIL